MCGQLVGDGWKLEESWTHRPTGALSIDISRKTRGLTMAVQRYRGDDHALSRSHGAETAATDDVDGVEDDGEHSRHWRRGQSADA